MIGLLLLLCGQSPLAAPAIRIPIVLQSEAGTVELSRSFRSEIGLRVPELQWVANRSQGGAKEETFLVRLRPAPHDSVEIALWFPSGEQMFALRLSRREHDDLARRLALLVEGYLRLNLKDLPPLPAPRVAATPSTTIAAWATLGAQAYPHTSEAILALSVGLTAYKWQRLAVHVMVSGQPIGRRRQGVVARETSTALVVGLALVRRPIAVEVALGSGMTVYSASLNGMQDLRVEPTAAGVVKLRIPMKSSIQLALDLGADLSPTYPTYGAYGRALLRRGPWRLGAGAGLVVDF